MMLVYESFIFITKNMTVAFCSVKYKNLHEKSIFHYTRFLLMHYNYTISAILQIMSIALIDFFSKHVLFLLRQ